MRGNDRKRRKPPRWVVPFLRALQRTGEVRAAAEDAGIDHSTAYARRRSHADFAEAWEKALEDHEERLRRGEEEALGALAQNRSTISSSGNGPTPPPAEDLIGAGSQLKRAGNGRWSQAKEKLFFEELAATANVKRAAKAADISTNAVYARRIKDRLFRAKWAAVLESGKAGIEMMLVEAANRSFDPDEIDTGEVEPKVSVAEAIRITQLSGSKAQSEELPDPYAEQAASMSPDGVAELREGLIRKLRRIRDRDMPDMIARGWSFDEAHDHMVPPGWIRDPDYTPEEPQEPEEPVDFDALYR